MDISVQYLEGGSQPVPPTPAEARARLRAAFDILPIEMVLLGWDLPPELVEACAEECQARGAGLFLWHPLLSGRRDLHPAKGWQVVGLNGEPVAGHAGNAEFTFVCPNQPAAKDAVLAHLDSALASGWYQDVFLDRIRFPSPATNPECDLGCFCRSCRTSAAEAGVDLANLQAQLISSLRTPQGRRSAARGLLGGHARNEGETPRDALDRLLAFRRQSVTRLVQSAAAAARARGMLVGLDCYSPTLARIVGQDLAALAAFSDWIKIMTYVRAFGPACIPFEVLGLADWLMTSGASRRTLCPRPSCRRSGLASARDPRGDPPREASFEDPHRGDHPRARGRGRRIVGWDRARRSPRGVPAGPRHRRAGRAGGSARIAGRGRVVVGPVVHAEARPRGGRGPIRPDVMGCGRDDDRQIVARENACRTV